MARVGRDDMAILWILWWVGGDAMADRINHTSRLDRLMRAMLGGLCEIPPIGGGVPLDQRYIMSPKDIKIYRYVDLLSCVSGCKHQYIYIFLFAVS